MSNENQILSKNTVYKSLSSYFNKPPTASKEVASSEVHDDLSNDTTRLYSLLINCSKKYHGHIPSKVLREHMLDSRLNQRSLTLVGGGVNNSLNSLNKKERKRTREYALSNKYRKKKRILACQDNKEKELNNSGKNNFNNLPRTVETQEVLHAMNKMWNEHLKRNIANCKDKLEMSSKVSNIELAGAYITILSSHHINPRIIGQNGIILEESKQTWVIAITDYYNDVNSKKKKSKYDDVVQIIRMPKAGASLALRFSTTLLSHQFQDNYKSDLNTTDANYTYILIKGPESKKIK